MKKLLLLGATLILGCMMSLTSCTKDDPQPGTGTNTISSLFHKLRSTPQTFTVTAGTFQTITGTKGTKITFNPLSFKDQSGNIISAGEIKISLIEMYDAGDMIANKVTTTTAANRMLTSGGSVNIKATLNDHEVFANNYSLGFKQPAMSENPMAIFKGYQVIDETGTNVKWLDDTTGTVARTVKDTTDQQRFYYLFESVSDFNWINCDYFYNAPDPKTNITIVAPDNSYDLTNTQVFVIFPSINSVSSMYAYNAASHSFSFSGAGYHIPVGATVHILILGAKNDNYFMDLHEGVTVTNGMSINFTPASATESSIQATLSNL